MNDTPTLNEQPDVLTKKKVSPTPAAYHTVTPYLIVKGAAKAIDFYHSVFGASETMRFPGPNGTIVHAEIKIGDSPVMLADEMPGMEFRSASALEDRPSASCYTSRMWMRARPRRLLPARRWSSRCRTNSTATAPERSLTPSAIYGPLPPILRTSHRRRCSGACPR